MATSVQKRAWMAELWDRLRRHNDTDLESAFDLLNTVLADQIVDDLAAAIPANYTVQQIVKAAAQDMRVVLTPDTEYLSIAALNAAEDNEVTVDVTCSLTDAEGNLHSWYDGSIFALTPAEVIDDEHISAPSLGEGEDTPALAAGTVTVTLSFDADEGSTKTYIDGDYVTLTAASVSDGDQAGAVFGVDPSYSTYSVATITAVGVPTITNVEAATGDVAGGAEITLTGTRFIEVESVTFDGVAATFTVKSDTEISCVSPAAAEAGAINIVVTALGGESTATGNFTYTSS